MRCQTAAQRRPDSSDRILLTPVTSCAPVPQPAGPGQAQGTRHDCADPRLRRSEPHVGVPYVGRAFFFGLALRAFGPTLCSKECAVVSLRTIQPPTPRVAAPISQRATRR
jgi:hypothetical protein